MQGFFYESLTMILRVPQRSVCHYEVSSIDKSDSIIIISIISLASSTSSESNTIPNFTGFFHLTHNVMITVVDCISFKWSSINNLTCSLTNHQYNQCHLLIIQAPQAAMTLNHCFVLMPAIFRDFFKDTIYLRYINICVSTYDSNVQSIYERYLMQQYTSDVLTICAGAQDNKVFSIY